MADKKGKQAAKQPVKKVIKKGRTVDKWKKKQWYTIIAPREFDKKTLGETVAEKPKNLENRIIKVDLGQLTGQRQKRHISIMFKVEKVEGNNASTQVVGHKINPGFMNRLVRRRASKIEHIQTSQTADKKRIRVKTVALSVRKLSNKQKTSIRKEIETAIEKAVHKKQFPEVSQEIIFGVTASKLFKRLTKIAPVKRVEIIKSRLLEGK